MTQPIFEPRLDLAPWARFEHTKLQTLYYILILKRSEVAFRSNKLVSAWANPKTQKEQMVTTRVRNVGLCGTDGWRSQSPRVMLGPVDHGCGQLSFKLRNHVNPN